MGFGYGKIDYIIHNGKMSVFDADNTPGAHIDPQVNARLSEQLAQGIRDFID